MGVVSYLRVRQAMQLADEFNKWNEESARWQTRDHVILHSSDWPITGGDPKYPAFF